MNTEPRRWAPWVELGAILVAVSVFMPGRLEWSNADEYTARAFGNGFLQAFSEMLAMDAEQGRCRPVYWLLTGLAGTVAGSSATAFVALRLLSLAAAVWLQIRISLRLGAALVPSALAAIAVAWSRPALAIWNPAGPAEAFANPLALGCTLLLLRASSARNVAIAAGVGLAAGLAKENYGAWTAAALGAFALSEMLRGRRGAPFWTAAGGAVLQFLPAAIATLGVRVWSSSYLSYVVTGLKASPSQTALVAVDQNAAAVVFGLVGLAVVAARLLRRRPAEWAPEDLVVVAILGGVALSTFALGLVIPRYHLPLGTALYLVAARGSRALVGLRRERPLTVALAVALAVVVIPAGARAVVDARTTQAMRRLDEGLRETLRYALRRYGAARVYWIPELIEHPVGALKHLEVEGLRGSVEIYPCAPPPPESAEMLLGLFRKHSTPVNRPAPHVASTWCPGVRAPPAEQECWLTLPGFLQFAPSYGCRWHPQRAAVVAEP